MFVKHLVKYIVKMISFTFFFPFPENEGMRTGLVKLFHFGFLTILGLVRFDLLEEFEEEDVFFWM